LFIFNSNSVFGKGFLFSEQEEKNNTVNIENIIILI